MHHSLKTVRKAMKQAKAFEVRKITRRLIEAKAAGSSSSSTGLENVAKLEQQLQAAKHADLEQLVQQAAAKAGLIPACNSNTDSTAAGASTPVAAAVTQRLLSAACVKKELSARVSEYKRKFGDADEQQHKAAKRSTAVTDRAATADADTSLSSGGISGDPGEASDGAISEDLEAAFAAQQAEEEQQQQQGNGELDAATAALLDKLRDRSWRRRGPDGGSDSSDDVVLSSGTPPAGDESDASQEQGQAISSGSKGARQPGAAGPGTAQHHKQQKQQQPTSAAAAPEAAGAGADAGVARLPTQQQQQQQQPVNKRERLQQKKRAKLEKLLKRGKRLGQRMRRQVYEKLYGAEARHLQGAAAGRGDGSGMDDRRGVDKQGRGKPVRGARRAASEHMPSKPREQAADASLTKQQHNTAPQQPEQPQQLHPSWEARKQQKKQILSAAPAAQKVVFADDGQPLASNSPGKSRQQKQQQHKAAHRPQQPSAGKPIKQDDTLHPSWAARQQQKKQQVVISTQPAARNKVVFDDD